MVIITIFALILFAEVCKYLVGKNQEKDGSCLMFMFYLMCIVAVLMIIGGLIISLDFYVESFLVRIGMAIFVGLYILYSFATSFKSIFYLK